jgi:transcriptional regulator
MSNLGRPKPHSAKFIRERREKVLILMSRGYNQSDIAKELGTTRNTVLHDLKHINVMTKHGLYDLAKQTLSTMYYNCLIGQNELAKECWKLYKNPNNDPSINNWHKIAALRLLIDINKSKFQMFQDGPIFVEIGRLQSELGKIKETYLKDNSFRPFVKPAFRYDEEHKRNCNLPDIDDDNDKSLVNAQGIPNRIEKFDDDDSSQEIEKENDSDKEDSDTDDEDE